VKESDMNTDRFDTVVIGGGQAGLAAGSCLKAQGRDLVPRRGA
jgi:cation diffusion facilitator CzcD-associated flavoprotein CzcO